MAADYVVISPTNRPALGSQLITAANKLMDLRDLVDALSKIAGHQFNGGDYTVFEDEFGLIDGQGANVLTLLGLLQNILNTNTDVTGANRLAQLDEFVARLAGQ